MMHELQPGKKDVIPGIPRRNFLIAGLARVTPDLSNDPTLNALVACATDPRGSLAYVDALISAGKNLFRSFQQSHGELLKDKSDKIQGENPRLTVKWRGVRTTPYNPVTVCNEDFGSHAGTVMKNGERVDHVQEFGDIDLVFPKMDAAVCPHCGSHALYRKHMLVVASYTGDATVIRESILGLREPFDNQELRSILRNSGLESVKAALANIDAEVKNWEINGSYLARLKELVKP